LRYRLPFSVAELSDPLLRKAFAMRHFPHVKSLATALKS
jgi:hypothetical protein